MANLSMAKILGIDIGFVNTGLALVDLDTRTVLAYDCIQTKKTKTKVSQDNFERCCLITKGLTTFLTTHKVDMVVAEAPHGGSKGARAARAMALASGATAASLQMAGKPWALVGPMDVRKVAGVPGTPAEDKSAVQAFVLANLSWPSDINALPKDRWEHIADAAAAVFAWEAKSKGS